MAFKMDGKIYKTMMEIARELGRARVKRQDFERFGIVEVDEAEIEEVKEELEVTEVKDESIEEVTEEAGLDKDDILDKEYPGVAEKEAEETEEKKERKKMTEEEKKERRAQRRKERRERKRKEREEANKPTPEMLERAKELREKAGYSDDIWEWAVDMKKKTAEEVFELAEELGLEWDRHETQRIDRMRAVMTLRENLYPGQKRPRVRKSSWSGVPNEEIAKICEQHNVSYPDTANERITRMHMIKALKEVGIESPEN